jgi:hypothetical protein
MIRVPTNLKTAKVLALTIPTSLLARAGQIMEWSQEHHARCKESDR